MIAITLPDGSKREFAQPVTVAEVAASIGPGLAKSALAGKVDGKVVDLSHRVDADAQLAIVTDKSPEGLEVLRHSTAHLLAYAVKELFPEAQVTIGPVIENGFFYDFSYKRPFTPEDANLKAQRSENFDLSVEYYLPRSGVVSAAVFRKELRDVIFRSQWKNPGEPTTIYFQERNGSSGKATGLELSWQQALSFLPRPLDGFGVNLNATFIRGSSVLDELVPGSTSTYRPLPVDFLPEQPKKVYNAQLYWERFGITARVAVNYIGEFVRTSGGLTSFSVNDEATRVDASLSYQISRQFTVYTEGRNLTNEVTSWYATTRSRPEDYLYTGAIYTAGIRFRF